jgi:hypothetical protein
MNPNNMTRLSFNLSGIGPWLTIFAVIWLLGSVGLGWLVKSIAILLVLLAVAPVIAFVVFRWWLRRNLVEDQCPVCDYTTVGLNGTQLRCPNCSEPLQVEQGHFVRLTPPGTVDVQAVEVSAQVVDDVSDRQITEAQ